MPVDEDAIPPEIVKYAQKHRLESTINQIVNRVVKERPEDPLSQIASMLLAKSTRSFPTFDKIVARRVYL